MTIATAISRVFKVRYDMSTEGCSSFWEAHALITKEAQIDPAEIHNVEYMGDSCNGWPEIAVTFNCIETAKMYTAIYLGHTLTQWDIYTDEEVNSYIADGEFVG